MEDEMNVHGQLSIASVAPKKTKKRRKEKHLVQFELKPNLRLT